MSLVVVRGSFDGAERRSISRDVARGLLVRVRPGVHVPSSMWTVLNDHARHVVRMRALVATTSRPLVFSHWSAAVVHRLPFLGGHRLQQLHLTVPAQEQRGTRTGVRAHVLPMGPEETQQVGELVVTTAARTVVDVAGATPFDEGVVMADGALRAHLPRRLLDQAVDLAASRRAAARIASVAAFAHPGGESPAESESRVLMFRHGIEPPELQHAFSDQEGFAGRTDIWWPGRRVIGEVDGRTKYLDSDEPGAVVYREKRREDRLRALSDGFARWGWAEAVAPALLLPVLARVGVVPVRTRPTLGDWAALARRASPAPLRQPDRVLLRG